MSNKLTFTEPGKAKVSWQVQYNEEQLENSALDSIVLNVNGEPQQIDLNSNSHEIDINESSNIDMEIVYGGVSTKTKKLYVDIIKDEEDQPSEPETPTIYDIYFGSVMIGKGLDWTKGGKEETMDFLSNLNKTIIDGMIDNSPIASNVAHANKLILSDTSKMNPLNFEYGFVGASDDDVIAYSQPIVLYPKLLGTPSKITDVMGNPLSINSTDNLGFYSSTMMIGDIEYYVYVHKVADSTYESESPVYINFVK